jgi:hypothetical protein
VGKVFLYSGANILAAGPPDAEIDFSAHSSSPAGGSFGHALAAAGDADGDGIDDILVGAPLSKGTGQAFLFSGRDLRVLAFVSGDQAGDRMGWSVASLPDLTGDGKPEFLAGAPWASSERGMVRLMTLDANGRVGAVFQANGCSPTPASLPSWSLPNGLPAVGHAGFSWGVANGTTGNLAALVVGVVPLQPPILLPILTPGCFLHTTGVGLESIAQFGGLPAAQNGLARIGTPVPNVPQLRGTTFLAQWYLVRSNLLDAAMTNMLQVTIQ